jgi:MtN3 and saliva related transmembrane protein
VIVSVFDVDNIVACVEFVFGLCLVINAGVFIPQAVKIYKSKNVQGLSLVTFLGFNFVQLFTILHAMINSDMILLYGTLLSFITCAVVSFFIFKYS